MANRVKSHCPGLECTHCLCGWWHPKDTSPFSSTKLLSSAEARSPSHCLRVNLPSANSISKRPPSHSQVWPSSLVHLYNLTDSQFLHLWHGDKNQNPECLYRCEIKRRKFLSHNWLLINSKYLSSTSGVLSVVLGIGDKGKQNLCSHKVYLLIMEGRQVNTYVKYLSLRE